MNSREAKTRSPWLFRGGLAVVVVAGASWLLMARGDSAPPPTPEELGEIVVGMDVDSSVGINRGSESASVTVEEFYDFSCPFCASFSGFAGKLLRQNYVDGMDAPVRWISYDYVLGTFPNSVAAALAARCANEQGLFWPVHDLILSRQMEWQMAGNPSGTLTGIARESGVDMDGYETCMAERRYLEEIAKSRKYGDSRGVSSTPTLFIDGEPISLAGVDPYRHIAGLIDAKLEAGSVGDAGESGS